MAQHIQEATLLLHFDVNKTLIINDAAAGKSMDDLINQIVMSGIWGQVINENDKLKFIISDCGFRSTAPQTSEMKLIDYYGFVQDILHPYPKYDESVSLEDRRKNNAIIKNTRTQIVKNFLKTDIGKNYTEEAAKLKMALLRPSSKLHGVTIETATQADFVNIVPAFFSCLFELCDRRRNFQLIIRTFGDMSDIESVIDEINTFCQGKHIDYPLNNEQLEFFSKKQIHLEKHQTIGHMYRNSKDTCYFVSDTLAFKPEMLQFKPIEEMNLPENNVISGFEKIYENIIENSSSGETRVIRDFYYWWNANNEQTFAGKVFLISEKDTEHFQIFFDDNVCSSTEFPIKGIVDLRSIETGESLDQTKYLGRYIVNAYALDFLNNPRYYIEKIDQAEKHAVRVPTEQ